MTNETVKSLPVNERNSTCRFPSYVLITPARNEEAFIGLVLDSMVRQCVKPLRWVIVSDGSTDGTDEIVARYAKNEPWIVLVRAPERSERHFAGKVHAFNLGYDVVKELPYDIIGNLDADISFDSGYFEFLLEKFRLDPELGVAGTPFTEGVQPYTHRFSRKDHVSGACQLFRRQCFESIGGYSPRKGGGVDLIAVVSARMKGWKTESFSEMYCIHHRRMGTANSHVLSAIFKSGYGDYPLGVHPVWQLLRSVYQMGRKPVFIGGVLLLAGYLWAVLTCARRNVSKEFVRFRRKEQMQCLNDYFKRMFLFRAG